jgi:hypothetical protein
MKKWVRLCDPEQWVHFPRMQLALDHLWPVVARFAML